NLGEPWSLVNAVSSPIKFGEYTSCGVPVILSEGVGDFSQATRERDLGVVIPHSADAERTGALVSAFVARFDADREGYRERCRSFAMEELAIDRHIPRLVSLYEQL